MADTYDCCEHCEPWPPDPEVCGDLFGGPKNTHKAPCPDGCNDPAVEAARQGTPA